MTGCYTCGGGMGRHDPIAHDQQPETPPPCLNCGCPWNSCLIHAEFCCDACAHFDPPCGSSSTSGGAPMAHSEKQKSPGPGGPRL